MKFLVLQLVFYQVVPADSEVCVAAGRPRQEQGLLVAVLFQRVRDMGGDLEGLFEVAEVLPYNPFQRLLRWLS